MPSPLSPAAAPGPPPEPLRETASQTAGPYLHIGLAPEAAGIEGGLRALGGEIAGDRAAGERIRVEGVVLDGAGEPVRDALIEIWQADAAGLHPGGPGAGATEPGFRGWGRAAADPVTGLWSARTIKPGRAGGAEGQPGAPHLALWIVARGINLGLHTRLYFPDEAEANAADPVLSLIEPARRPTLLARRREEEGRPVYRLDIRLQGEGETVFLDL